MNQLQNKSFEEALVRYREKWDKIKDPCVVYDFPIPDVSCKELFLKRVSEHPDKTYVISCGAKMSYVECNTLAAKIANGFLANGLKKGDRVITYCFGSRGKADNHNCGTRLCGRRRLLPHHGVGYTSYCG